VLQDYAYMCEEAYLSGSHELNLEPLVSDEPVSSSLRLRSVGLIKIDKIQNSPSQRILRVLFDTGSDKTLINKRALPKQAISAKDPSPSNITGVHGTKPLNHFVMLNGMQFPEFAPTTKVAKPIKAIVFDNEESSYDVILRMDVL
jgi:Aspartyl protease